MFACSWLQRIEDMSMTVMFLLSEKLNDCFCVLIDDIWGERGTP